MLWVTATPVGDPGDLTLRALAVLRDCDLIICESTKETSRLLKSHGITGRSYEVLDEHSSPDHVLELVERCGRETVALVSDGGTPAFCDPGADLVAQCRQRGIEVRPLLGASSLMGLLCMAGQRLDRFLFRGFLPAETTARRTAWKELSRERQPIVIMDTPYRLKKVLAELEEFLPHRRLFLCRDLSLPSEMFLEGTATELRRRCGDEKAEFMLLIRAER